MISGIGGLGHMAVQYAREMGLNVAAVDIDDGKLALAKRLGATVTVRLASTATEPDVQVPLGAILDDGQKTGVWVLDNATSTVHFRPVKLLRVSGDTAVISGLVSGDRIVALGAHLLREGAPVRIASERGGK